MNFNLTKILTESFPIIMKMEMHQVDSFLAASYTLNKETLIKTGDIKLI